MILPAVDADSLRAYARALEHEAQQIRWNDAPRALTHAQPNVAHWLGLKASLLEYRADEARTIASIHDQH